MTTPRFYVAAGLSPSAVGGVIPLPESVAHHAVRVDRLPSGAALTLFDGLGGEYRARLASVERRSAYAAIESFDPVERESPLRITLWQAIAANDAMDHAVRKAVELGVHAIVPLVTARSAPFPAGERGAKRVTHWGQVVIAACEQCGRNRIPPLAAPVPIGACAVDADATVYVCAPHEGVALGSVEPRAATCSVIVGPEGGLAAEEIALMQARGAVAVTLGPRVLRTETAGSAALAILQARWGDLA